jgi:hypothetical protein
MSPHHRQADGSQDDMHSNTLKGPSDCSSHTYGGPIRACVRKHGNSAHDQCLASAECTECKCDAALHAFVPRL